MKNWTAAALPTAFPPTAALQSATPLARVLQSAFPLAAALLLALLLTACGGDLDVSEASEADSVTAPAYHVELTLSHVFGPEEPISLELKTAADKIRERTYGAVDIRLFGSAQLPVYRDSLLKVLDGENWIACEDPSYLADYNINFEALCAPMLYDTVDQYSYVCQSDAVLGMCRDIETRYNIHVLLLDLNLGLRGVLANKAVATPEDMAGMRIRVPDSSLYLHCMEAMGAIPVPIPLSNTLPALEQETLDGLDGTASLCTEFSEGAKQFTRTKHMNAACGLYLNSRIWNDMPEEYQIITQDEFAMAARRLTAAVNGDDARKKLIEQGCQIREADLEAFRAAMAPEYERMVREDGVTDSLIPLLRDIAAGYTVTAAED